MEWTAVLLTAGLVLITGWYAWQTQQMVREMRRAREIQAEPRVELRIEHEKWNPAVLVLVVSNGGGGPARDVRFTFDQPVPYRRQTAEDTLTLSDLPLFQRIPVLAAGKEIVLYFNVFAIYWNDKDAPKRFNYTASYKDVFGKSHTSTEEIDVGLMFQTAPVWDHPIKKIAGDTAKLTTAIEHYLREIAESARGVRRPSLLPQPSWTRRLADKVREITRS